jgi:beta-glucosidase
MGKNQNFDRFMRQVGEDGKMVVEVSPEAFSTAAGTGFDLRYFPNKALEGEVKATGHLEKMDFFIGGSPTQGIPENYWSMTAESTFTAPETGNVMFVMTGDDAYRLIVDGKELFSDWGDHAETTRNAAIPVEAGKKYNIRIEYYDNEYNAILRMQTLFFK